MDTDEFDLLSAIWIMACNDENELITYEGIRDRLNPNCDVETLIQRHRELFRPVGERRLAKWKESLKKKESPLPGWILRRGTEEAQIKAIDALSVKDVFRSQFRAVPTSTASTTGFEPSDRSQIQIIEWGLQHLDRRRKAKLEAEDLALKTQDLALKTQDLALKTQDLAVKTQDLSVKTKDLAVKTKDLTSKYLSIWLVFGVALANIIVSVILKFVVKCGDSD